MKGNVHLQNVKGVSNFLLKEVQAYIHFWKQTLKRPNETWRRGLL